MKRISAIVLVAGLSSRMGKFKPLLPYQGRSVIRSVVEKLTNTYVEEIIVITGHNADLIKAELSNCDVKIRYNKHYKEGMHTSVMAGVASISEFAEGFMIVLGDQPQLSTILVNKLIKLAEKSNKGILVPSYSNRRGHPVLFDIKYREAASCLDPEKGLKKLIIEYEGDIEYIIATNDNVLIDIDTPEDYQNLLKNARDD